MNDRPRVPRQPLSPSAKVFAAMFVALIFVLFALLMTGAVSAIVWLVRWIMAAGCGS